ncbi:Hypothetical predicted protein [Lecanosticta acicola]|uniref:Pal1 cell morphology n=1 Tax=Lecanosticta acicola TaxID=111012 RepID=A0AAI8Z1X2_9PEZI|nr:Hypothetical predicted protein [Lecanosticta acicola]
MAQAMGSKEAAAYLIDPMNAPEPSQETGPGAHFGSTFTQRQPTGTSTTSSQRSSSLGSNNPFRNVSNTQTSPRHSPSNSKNRVSSSSRPISNKGSPPRAFPAYRAEAFGDYHDAPRRRSGSQGRSPPSYNDATSGAQRHRRRTSSLKERYPGDDSVHPLDVIRKNSKRADRSPHLKKRHQPGADTIDRLDPAIGGRAYHHEGPYDAALLARNSSFEIAPIAALQSSNEEALKATPQENIRDAVERHKPLDGVAQVPPGVPDRLGRTYNYEEGADLMREENSDGPGYKRWPDKEYDPSDLKGRGDLSYGLDKALKAHKISDSGIEMVEGSRLNRDYDQAKRHGSLDGRDPIDIAGGESRYVDMQLANAKDNDIRRSSSLRQGLKKRIGSLRKKNRDE